MKYRAKKRFGQNFLQDKNIIAKIVQAIDPQPQDHLVEIGPGRGALTDALLGKSQHLEAIELDRDLYHHLQERYQGQAIQLHQADALRFEFCALGEHLRIIGNLPYNISTPLIFHLLAQLDCIQDMHFMLQKEVVERMVASPGSKTYGRLSVMVQLQCEVKSLFTIKPQAFYPVPKVDSALVRLVPRAQLLIQAEEQPKLAEIVSAAFAHRRKTLRNNLKAYLSPEQMSACQIDPGQRAEQLSLQDFICLARQL